MKTVFYSHIDCFSLPGCIHLSWSGVRVYYFDVSPTAHLLLKLFGRDKQIQYFDFKLYEMKDQNGEGLIMKIYAQDMLDLCDKIQTDILEKDAFVRDCGRIFDCKKMLIFFRKLAYKELCEPVIFMNVINYFRKHAGKSELEEVEFRFEKDGFSASLKEFAATRHDLSAMPVLSFRKTTKVMLLLVKGVVTLGKTMIGPVLNFEQFRAAKKNSSPKIGIPYRYGGINFDPAVRNDFPYLLASDIPFERVLVYFDSKHGRVPTADDIANIRAENGVRYMAVSKKTAVSEDILLYKPTLGSSKQALSIFGRLFFPIFRGLLSLKSDRLCVARMLLFISQYSLSYDYFCANNIKIVVERDYSDLNPIADEIALRDTGGVSIHPQLSTLPFPNAPYGLCADVIFLFSPRYLDVIERSGSDNDTVVFTGFLTDSSFAATKEAASKLRNRLISNGAKFIVAYFDESSVDNRMSFISHKQAELVYAKLLEWVLQNDRVGIIFSPKCPDILFSRISGISHLIEKANSTGRCIFMKGQTRTFSWPAEAFQASDLTIGLLVGGTTVLGSLLAGQKSVYLDTIGLHSWPEYLIGKDDIVFDNIDNLVAALDKYRQTNGNSRAASDSKPFLDLINSKSLFRDGRADERMGQYIKWLLDSFDGGLNRSEAIRSANRRYSAMWGGNKTIDLDLVHDDDKVASHA